MGANNYKYANKRVRSVTRGLEFPTTGIKELSFDVTLTAAEILALFTTPKSLIAAPGANKFNEIISAALIMTYATAYTIGSATNLELKYTDGSGAAITTAMAVTGILDQTANQVRIMNKLATNVTPVVNAAVVLALAGANPTGGTSTLRVRGRYRVVPTAL